MLMTITIIGIPQQIIAVLKAKKIFLTLHCTKKGH